MAQRPATVQWLGLSFSNWSALVCCQLALLALVVQLSLSTTSSVQASSLEANQIDQRQVAFNQSADTMAMLMSADQLEMAASDRNYAASGSGSDYGQQEQQLPAAKAKKIQIVYIKVPLAKLRPSLSNQGSDYNSNYSSKSNSNEHYESTNGSQILAASADEHQQQLSLTDDATASASDEHQQQQQSFLIPMALVQTQSNDEPSAGNALDDSAPASQPAGEASAADEPVKLIGSASSQSLAAQPTAHQADQSHQNGRRSPVQLHRQRHNLFASAAANQYQLFPNEQLLARPSQQSHHPLGASISHSLEPGFMSSFLSAEKEKMTAAALRLRHQAAAAGLQMQAAGAMALQQAASSNNGRQVALSQLLDMSASGQATSSLTSPNNNNNHSSTTTTTTQQQPPKPVGGPGGLMPNMIAPLSRMPDNAIGQAYGAAVGNALPAESGSPSSLLGSPSTASGSSNGIGGTSHNSNHGAGHQQAYHGGASGKHSDAGSSSGTGSSGSYGTGGLGQPGAGSSGTNYGSFIADSASSGPSSGYGSSISTLRTLGALSDYSAGSHPAASSSSSNYNRPSSPFQQQPEDGYGSQASQQPQAAGRLKQAKKTIIPIVVQVEHAILESANAAQQQQQAHRGAAGNKYSAGRANRQLNGKRSRANYGHQNQNQHQQLNGLYGAATNEQPNSMGAQFINAANAHDINQITAAINAENAASAAAALAQADMAFGPGLPAHFGPPQQQQHYSGPRGGARPSGPQQQSAYAAGLQSAASALLANTHPVLQAAASGGLASVSKLGAKLGEMIALPSMQVPGSISSLGAALPSALSSLTNQMVQQVAKEHPAASAFARQVAQQAGIQLPGSFRAPSGAGSSAGPHQGQSHAGNPQHQGAASSGQMLASSSQLLPSQAQLQNLKLSIGQNLQSAAAQLMGVQKSAAQQAANQQQTTSLNQMALSAALKQLGAISPAAAQLAGQLAGLQQSASSQSMQSVPAPASLIASLINGVQSESSSSGPTGGVGQQQQQQQHQAQQHQPGPMFPNGPISPLQQQQLNQFFQSQSFGQLASMQNQMAAALAQDPMGLGSASSPGQQVSAGLEQASAGGKPAKAASSAAVAPSTFKSKFLSFFQPPKFISNLLSWNDRADEREDAATSGGQMLELASVMGPANVTARLESANATSAATSTTAMAAAKQSDATETNKTTSLAPTNQSPSASSPASPSSSSQAALINASTTLAASSAATTPAPPTSPSTQTTSATSTSLAAAPTTTTNKREKSTTGSATN